MRHMIFSALMLAAFPVFGQSITDSSFEAPSLGPSKFTYQTPGSAWSFTGASGLAVNGSGFTVANPIAPQGSQVAFLQGTASVSQTITNWTPGDYCVVFSAAERNYPATGSTQPVSVQIDGQTVSTILPVGIAYQVYYTVPFTVAAGDHTLTFRTTTTGGDNTAFLDNVQVISPASIVPQAAATATVASSGKMISLTFTGLANGRSAVPSQILAAPSLSINGQPIGQCGVSWVTGYHPIALFATPGNYQIRPGDQVRVSAPVAWASTSAGVVQALDMIAENRTGKPMIATEALPRTLRIGVNNPQAPTSSGIGFYWPFKNIKYRVGWPPSNRGKFGSPGWSLSLSHNGMPNGVDATTYPGIAGQWLVMWDATQPDKPAQFGISSATPTKCTVTERQDLKVMPLDGVGCCRVFDVQPVAGGTEFDVSLSYADPAWTQGQANYSNLWVVQPGDWDVVNGQVVLDRSDPLALSRLYQDRVGPNVGSMRWVDSTVTGGNPQSCPYPEFLPTVTDESWGDISFYRELRGYTAVGPVDVTATPYIYSPFFKQPNQQFTATLGADITTTPNSGARETWIFPDGDTAPLMAGLEITDNGEVCRIISGARDTWTIVRGSNGTTPTTHVAGPVQVSGRRSIRDVLNGAGGMPRALIVQLTMATPHGRTTGNVIGCDGGGWPLVQYTDGSSWNSQGFARSAYVTGPTTFFFAIGAGTVSGGVPKQTYPLDPKVQTWDYRSNGMIPIEAAAIATGKFSKADFHVNIPIDACDDLVWELAKRVLANFPVGRRVYVEYGNEPWNWAFTSFYYHSGIMGPLSVPGNPYQLAHYAQRAGQVQTIFRQVFAASGRAQEIQGLINCQMGSGDSQVRPHLEYGQRMGTPFDAVAVGPYWSFENTPLNQKVAAALDDEQLVDLVMADQRTNPRTNNAWMASVTNALYGFNQKYQTNVKLIGYEGGIETAHPWGAARNHDLQYNPNWYFAETDWIAWCQTWGLDRLHVYSLAQWWNPESWGGYHTSQQRHSRGDGLNGAADNRLWRRGVRAAGVNQDSRVDSIRGQAWLDWLGTLQP